MLYTGTQMVTRLECASLRTPPTLDTSLPHLPFLDPPAFQAPVLGVGKIGSYTHGQRTREKFNRTTSIHRVVGLLHCTPYCRHISRAGRNMLVARAARQTGFNLQCQGHDKSFQPELT